MKKTILQIIALTIIFLAGCGNQTIVQSNQNQTGMPKTEQSGANLYPFSEISKHNSESNCWVLVTGRVYDITAYVTQHPAGKIILQGCGQEASQLFNDKHSEKAQNNLEKYYIGNLQSNEQ